MTERNGAMVNGALIALGATAILDNLLAHGCSAYIVRFPTPVPPRPWKPRWSLSASSCCSSGWSGSGTPGGDNRLGLSPDRARAAHPVWSPGLGRDVGARWHAR